jgi:hypothetical protein
MKGVTTGAGEMVIGVQLKSKSRVVMSDLRTCFSLAYLLNFGLKY